MKGKARTKALEDIASGIPSFVIGTHALFQEKVKSITCNEDDLQGIISGIMGRGIAPSNVYIDIQNFAGLGRRDNLVVEFPPYAEAKQRQWFKGTAVWSAVYIDDLEGVEISGSISF